jgi:hypothetical protein
MSSTTTTTYDYSKAPPVFGNNALRALAGERAAETALIGVVCSDLIDHPNIAWGEVYLRQFDAAHANNISYKMVSWGVQWKTCAPALFEEDWIGNELKSLSQDTMGHFDKAPLLSLSESGIKARDTGEINFIGANHRRAARKDVLEKAEKVLGAIGGEVKAPRANADPGARKLLALAREGVLQVPTALYNYCESTIASSPHRTGSTQVD